MLINLQLDWVRYKSGTPIARFGGLWDTDLDAWRGDAPESRVLEVHGAQIEIIECFADWMRDHQEGGRREFSDRIREMVEGEIDIDETTEHLLGLTEMYCSGGRRAGKTAIMEGILTSYSVAVERSIVWTGTPAESKHAEPVAVLKEIMPLDWYSYRGQPHYDFTLVNNSIHRMISGHKSNNFKQGNAALVGLNEAQNIKHDSYKNARGAVAKDGGFTIIACNPPLEGDVGPWVLDAVSQTEGGRRFGSKHFFFDPLLNPHIDPGKLLALKSSMTLHDFETQVRGRMLQLPNRVLYQWSQVENERRMPELVDCTNAFVQAHEGDKTRWDQIVVIDVQYMPWIAAGVFRVSPDPTNPLDPKLGLLWGIDEVAMIQGAEEDCAAELLGRGYRGDRTLVVMDATCRWQQQQRDPAQQFPKYKGMGSMAIMKACGFKYVVPPDRRMDGNPAISDRVRATNATILSAAKQRGLFADPKKCPNLVDSAQKWSMRKGKPGRREDAAHFGDVLGYLVWRFFPRRGSALRLLEDSMPRQPLAGAGTA